MYSQTGSLSGYSGVEARNSVPQAAPQPRRFDDILRDTSNVSDGLEVIVGRLQSIAARFGTHVTLKESASDKNSPPASDSVMSQFHVLTRRQNGALEALDQLLSALETL